MSAKIAAIWARVSTEDKQEPSLESQVSEVKSWLEAQGWEIPPERIITVHWTSKNILACPDMQRLLAWVKNGEVGAVGALHLDRFACRMGQMGQILDAFKEGSVELLAKNSPLQAGLLGEAMAMVITIAKALQVERADEGSKTGLHNRAKLRGLPTTCQVPYGYRWNESRTRLLSNLNWPNRKLILSMFLEGDTIKGIKRELERQAIPSPRGLNHWPEPTIWGILVDSVNFGEYRALRRENTEPKERRGKLNGNPTYGKTSSRKVSGIVLPNIEIENPVITREEYEWIMKRLAKNRLNSKRNGKHNFLLKGMVHYELDGRRYHGRHIRDNIWAYEYPDNGLNRNHHPRSYINGPRLEKAVEDMAHRLLSDETVLSNELGRKDQDLKESIANLETELRKLERRENANTNAEAQLLLDKNLYGKEITEEAFRRALGRLQTERKFITERRQEITRQLANLKDTASSMVGLKQLQTKLEKKLSSTDFADRREILEALGTKVDVTTDGRLEVDFTIPREISKEAIALNSPLNACPRYSIVLSISPPLSYSVVGKATS
ncbi:recombinase family protein [Chloroflexota bacterium]